MRENGKRNIRKADETSEGRLSQFFWIDGQVKLSLLGRRHCGNLVWSVGRCSLKSEELGKNQVGKDDQTLALVIRVSCSVM